MKEDRGVLCGCRTTSSEILVMVPPSTSKSPTCALGRQVGQTVYLDYAGKV